MMDVNMNARQYGKSSFMLGLATAMGLMKSSSQPQLHDMLALDTSPQNGSRQPSYKPRKKKAYARNPFRGYYARYSHVLCEYIRDINLAKKANGETGFKGFRKVRKFDQERGMTVWVNV